MLAAAAALLFSTSLLFGAVLAPRGPVSRVLAVALAAWAQVVVLCEVLSETRALHARGFLVGHVVLLATAIAAWKLAGRPAPVPAPRHLALRARTFVRNHRWLAVFAAAAGLVVALNAGWSFLYEPLDGDANAYHLPRAYYWTTLGTARHFPTSDFRLTQMPPDASFLAAWALAFSRGFRGLHLFQTAAGLALGAAAAALARLSGARRPAALFAGLLVLTLPVVVLQMGTAQNDLLAAAAGVTAVFFGIRALLEAGREAVCAGICFGLALGLAAGTKLTVAFLAPGLLLALLALAATRTAPGRLRAVSALGASAAGGFLLLGAYNAVLNVKEVGNPFAAKEGFSHFYEDGPEARSPWLAKAVRYAHVLPGMSPDGGDTAFGPLAFALAGLTPFAVAGSLFARLRRRTVEGAVRLALVFAALSYPAAYLAANPPFFPDGARFFVPAAVLLGAAVFPLLFFNAGAPRVAKAATAATAVMALAVAGELTRSGPGDVRRGAWRDPGFEDSLREDVVSVLARRLPACFPPGSRLGIVAEYNDTLFHLFRALPAFDFIPVAEADVPRLVRERRIAAAVVGEFRNASGQGVTKPGLAVPRNVLHVDGPEKFFLAHPDQFGARVVATDSGVEAHLSIDRKGFWAGNEVLVRLPSGLARVAGKGAVLVLPVGAAPPEGVTVSCAGAAAPVSASANGLVVPVPAACMRGDRVFVDLMLKRPSGGADLRLEGEALLSGRGPEWRSP